jgi:hypothetical protein
LIACSLTKGQFRRSSYFCTVFLYLRVGSVYSKLLYQAVELVG